MDQSEFLANLGFLSILGFAAVGGLEGLEEKYFLAMASNRSGNSSCGLPREDAFHIFRDPVTSDLPWPGILFGMSIPSLWYWCTDQVQGSRLSPWNASLGCLEAGFLSFPYLFHLFIYCRLLLSEESEFYKDRVSLFTYDFQAAGTVFVEQIIPMSAKTSI